MHPLIEFRRRITEGLQNGRELSRDFRFEEWLEVLYSNGLCGLDFIDVYEAVKDKRATLISFSTDNFTELTQHLDNIKEAEGLIIAIKLPQRFRLDSIKKIIEEFVLISREDAIILYQAVHKKRDCVKIILLYY